MTTHRRLADNAVPLPASRSELCLDFANTLSWRGAPTPEELLPGLPELLTWLTQTAGVPALVTAQAAAWQQDHPGRAAHLFADAIALREAVFRLFSAVATDATAAPEDIAALNAALAEAPARSSVVAHGGGFAWLTEPRTPGVAALLAPVLWSAADLLVEGAAHRIRRCANEKCLWLFIDRSKAGTRRWCDMAACGNRAKSQRHYARSKAG